MTKKELLEKLVPFPDDMQALIYSNGDFEFGAINSIRQQNVRFHEGTDNKDVEAFEECIILDDDF